MKKCHYCCKEYAQTDKVVITPPWAPEAYDPQKVYTDADLGPELSPYEEWLHDNAFLDGWILRINKCRSCKRSYESIELKLETLMEIADGSPSVINSITEEFDRSLPGHPSSSERRKAERVPPFLSPPKDPQGTFYRPRSALAAVIGEQAMLQTELVKKLWVYIQENNIPKNGRHIDISGDPLLQKLSKEKQISMFDITVIVKNHSRSIGLSSTSAQRKIEGK